MATAGDSASAVTDPANFHYLGGLSYGLGVSVAVVVLISVVTLSSYFCTRFRYVPTYPSPSSSSESGPTSSASAVRDAEMGLDEASIGAYPKLLYSDAKLRIRPESSASRCCSVCLLDYIDTDAVRLLPGCSHLFHLDCVDPWLRIKPTCPICRSSPPPIEG